MLKQNIPLAERLRPKCLKDLIGQEHLKKENSLINTMIQTGKLTSIIFWGPPGTGKTTLARLLVNEIKTLNPKQKIYFEDLSAIFSGVSDLKKIFKNAKERLKLGEETVLFVDEIHRFNKAQQDSFLPYIEDGTIKLLASTTENPSFRINSALLSRCNVLTLNNLNTEELIQIIHRAEQLLGNKYKLPITKDSYKYLASLSDGDARFLLNIIEQISNLKSDKTYSQKELANIIQKRFANYDTGGDEHYNLISALHKSLRGSDPDAGLYWLTRMINGGEDKLYILRRLVRFSTEDIGLADPQATQYAISCLETYKMLGSPEGDLAIANLVVYLALAPKSNSTYSAYTEVNRFVKKTGTLAPPKHILNAPTNLMKDLDYGKDYIYDHSTKLGFSGQNYFPDKLSRQSFYKPVERGFEREMLKRLKYFEKLRKEKNN